MTRTALCLLEAVFAAAALNASPVDSLFLGIPAAEMPELDRSARMDLLDLWDSGIEAKVPGTFGDTLCLTERTDSTLTLRLAEATMWHINIEASGLRVWEREVRLPGRRQAVIWRKEM